MTQYNIYVLIKDGKANYIGVTTNIKNRISKHKSNKDFDSYYIIKKCNDKRIAYNIENTLINFITLFGDENFINKKNVLLEFDMLRIRGKY